MRVAQEAFTFCSAVVVLSSELWLLSGAELLWIRSSVASDSAVILLLGLAELYAASALRLRYRACCEFLQASRTPIWPA